MNSNILMDEDITENIIALKVNRSYNENMTETELYDITRGYWRIDIKRAQYVDYTMSVYKDTIKYFNCVPNKNELINKEELCNNAVIEKAQKIEEEISSLNVEDALKKSIINDRVTSIH